MKTFIEILKEMPIQIVYINSERKGLKVPYGVYKRTKSNHIHADNSIYAKVESYSVEIYYSELAKQKETENLFENLLKENGFLFSKEPDISVDSDINMTLYSVERI